MSSFRYLAAVVVAIAVPLTGAAQARVLFDALHRSNAGNADWVIDADSWDLNQEAYPCAVFEVESHAQRFPTPPASSIGPTTPETIWTGAFSAFAVDLVKAGYDVETLPVEARLTFLDGTNPQDLSNYDVFVLPEPNASYTALETTAILDFVANGGGLFVITDHQTSDRDCDGLDSPHIGNDLMGVVIAGGSVVDPGRFGIVFNVEEIAGQTGADYWFTDATDNNVSPDPLDPIIRGPHGDGRGGLGLFGATSMTLFPGANSTVRGHVWRTGAVNGGTSRVTFATAELGLGRIACLGDSSPGDDGTGDPLDTLYFGWDQATGGVANREIHLNAVAWLERRAPDVTPPTITAGPSIIAADCSAIVSWITDEPTDGQVEHGPTVAYGTVTPAPTVATSHDVTLTMLTPSTTYHFRVASRDLAGNGPVTSPDDVFTTATATAPNIVAGPDVAALSATSATITWSADEPTDATVDYGLTTSYGAVVNDPTIGVTHSVVVGGLTPSTTYHFQVSSLDVCGNGPVASADQTFTTPPAGPPAADHVVISELQVRGAVDHDDEFIELYNPTALAVDLSGWSIQYKSASGTSYVTFALPSTSIAAFGYYLLARPEYTGSVAPDVDHGSFLMSASGGHVFLVDGTSALAGCTDPRIVDHIGYGSGDCPESLAAATHPAGGSLERAPGEVEPLCGNGTDSDDNAADFRLRAVPEPQSSSSTEVPCSGATLGDVGPTLRLVDIGATRLTWATASGATDYKVRRATTADFMATNPVPDDTYLLTQPTATSYDDADIPTTVFYYWVNAVGASGESAN